MKKGFKIFLRLLETIIAVPLCILGAAFLIPFMFLSLVIALPIYVIEDIWELYTPEVIE